ncbi:MAG: hypothetical protein ACK56I_30610, partial [bacterium]
PVVSFHERNDLVQAFGELLFHLSESSRLVRALVQGTNPPIGHITGVDDHLGDLTMPILVALEHLGDVGPHDLKQFRGAELLS